MKTFTLNLLALLLSPLTFTGESGGGAGKQAAGGTSYTPVQIFDGIANWSPSQFREAVSPDLARGLTDENKNTLLHKAIEVGSVDITRMLVNKPYGLDPNQTNGVGETAVDMAKEKGGDFAGIFRDLGTEG